MVSQRSLWGSGETHLLCESDDVQKFMREQFAFLCLLETLRHIWNARCVRRVARLDTERLCTIKVLRDECWRVNNNGRLLVLLRLPI